MNKKPEFLKEGEEPERVYYGNVCNKCFTTNNLSKCNACKKVQYCSKLHQQEDLPFHKTVCSFLAKYEIPKKDLSEDEFFFLKWKFMSKLQEIREPKFLTQYEKEICLSPWVCIICYTKDNLDFGCDKCRSVAYCSMEHKKKDEAQHRVLCSKLHLCKLFSSLGYQFGRRVKPINFKYIPIRQKVRRFPKEMKDLLKLIQKQVRTPSDDRQAINSGVFTGRYAAAGTIISCLETIGVITNRKYNWLPNKGLYRVVDSKPRPKNANIKLSAPLVIHMVGASDYEIQIPWNNFVELLIDWLINVHYIKIILVGKFLEGFKGFDFEKIKHIAGYECYASNYEDIVDQLDPPDIIMMHNFGYPNMEGLEEFITDSTDNCLFKYSKVPVIVAASFPIFLGQFTTYVKKLKDVEVLHGIATNQFCDCRAIRFWGSAGLQCSHINEYCAIYRKK